MLPLFQIREVVLMAVGFLLEAYVVVGRHAVAVLQKEDEPLQSVPDEEGQIEELALLCRVDELVVELHLVERAYGEDEATQTDGEEIVAEEHSLDEIDFMPLCCHWSLIHNSQFEFRNFNSPKIITSET